MPKIADGAVNGIEQAVVTTVTADYTVKATDEFIVCNATQAITVTLPTTQVAGKAFTILNKDASYGVTVKGAAVTGNSFALAAGFSSLKVASDGTSYYVLGTVS